MISIKKITISDEVKIKIYNKHNVLYEEIRQLLENDNPRYRKVGGKQLLAIGLSKSRYLTIYLKYDKKTKTADIQTAHTSDKKQIKSYKRLIRS